jgi:hypothetical protein
MSPCDFLATSVVEQVVAGIYIAHASVILLE